jgi:putative SOS response-associated peptidase YedK
MVITDGYYEWKVTAKGRQPYRIMLKSGEPFAMAGIYARMDVDRPEAAEHGPVNFAILTTRANDAMSNMSDRIPVILPLGREKEWLPPGGVPLFNPFPAELMTAYSVTPKINSTLFNELEAVAPLLPSIVPKR